MVVVWCLSCGCGWCVGVVVVGWCDCLVVCFVGGWLAGVVGVVGWWLVCCCGCGCGCLSCGCGWCGCLFFVVVVVVGVFGVCLCGLLLLFLGAGRWCFVLVLACVGLIVFQT